MLSHPPPRCHLRQLWTQKWQKAAAPLTIKPRAEPLIVPEQRENYLPPGPPSGPGGEEGRGGRGRRGCVDGQNGRMGCRCVWAGFLATPPEGVAGRWRSLPRSQLLRKPEARH